MNLSKPCSRCIRELCILFLTSILSVRTVAFTLAPALSQSINNRSTRTAHDVGFSHPPQIIQYFPQLYLHRTTKYTYTKLWSSSSSNENENENSNSGKRNNLSKDISKHLKPVGNNEKKTQTSPTPTSSSEPLSSLQSRNNNQNGAGQTVNPSILPPLPTETSERFPNRRGGRGGGRARMRRSGSGSRTSTSTSTRPKGEEGGGEARQSQPLNEQSILPPPTSDAGGRGDRKRTRPGRGSGRGNFANTVGSRKFKPRRGAKSNKFKRDGNDGQSINGSGNMSDGNSIKSLLPPKGEKRDTSETSVLASWDDFFATSPVNNDKKLGSIGAKKGSEVDSKKNPSQEYFEKSLDAQIEKINNLPSPSYLFGANVSAGDRKKVQKDSSKPDDDFSPASASALSSLDGVLPVSELFYRSTQSLSGTGVEDVEGSGDIDQNYLPKGRETDDEELPFSAEQSDQILTENNKILMKRNQAKQIQSNGNEAGSNDGAKYKTDLSKLKASSAPPINNQNNGKRNRRNRGGNANGRYRNDRNSGQKKGRKLIRRGMEMLVGGLPINADPPLRFMELDYCLRTADALSEGLLPLKEDESNGPAADWASVITTNSRDFGPLLHKSSVSKVSDTARQLYCEHFIDSSIKWNVCPKDLRSIVAQFEAAGDAKKSDAKTPDPITTYKDLVEKVSNVTFNDTRALELKLEDGTNDIMRTSKGFGKDTKKTTRRSSGVGFNVEDDAASNELNRAARRSLSKQDTFTLGGELKFSLGVTRSELESGNDGSRNDEILRRVLGNGIAKAIKAEELGFNVVIAKMLLNEIEGGSTEFNVEFNMTPEDTMKYNVVEFAAKRINSALAQAMDDGYMALSMGAVAKAETAWPTKVRDRIVEEFLFDAEDDDGINEEFADDGNDDNESRHRDVGASDTLDDDDDFEAHRENEDIPKSRRAKVTSEKEFDGPFGMPGDTMYAKDDIYLGGGNGGVFADYSENGKFTAPFKGELGPLLVDAVTQRAIERQPRVIAIGDVHGCIDELQALLRRCDYRPGDLIVFLGDLVSKGPDSLAVVQMARELGAIGVRGNHDFEVIRWHQAIKSGK
jgi:hypothetical protein